MIRLNRSQPEPPDLAIQRAQALPKLRSLPQVHGDDIDGYQVARDALYQCQFGKCCYCEQSFERKHRPVEHFRPKSIYWWLSWTWENLFFCCEICNEYKSDRFPLRRVPRLIAEQTPPGREKPMLIDPTLENPMDHLRFAPFSGRWLLIPRNGSVRGAEVIQICRLNRPDLVERYNIFSQLLLDRVDSFRQTLEGGQTVAIQDDWERLTGRWLSPRSPFTALSHDILDYHFPATFRRRHNLALSIKIL